MDHRNRWKVFVPVLAAFFLLAVPHAFGQESPTAKVKRLMNESGAKVHKSSEDTWTLPFQGKALKDITVVATVGEGLLITFALIPESKDAKFPPQVLLKLLNLNEDFDRVKVGIDKDGILFVRSDVAVRTLDKEDLTTTIDQVAAAIDEVYGHVRAHLPKAK